MKLLKPLLFYVLLLMSTLITKTSVAQSPPVNYTSIPSGNQTLDNDTLSNSNEWYRWVADTGVVHAGIKVKKQGYNQQLSSAELYTVRNDTLFLMFRDTLVELGDSSLNLYAGYVSPNTVVYLRLKSAASSCTSCVVGNSIIILTMENSMAGCGPSVPCDMVKNGNFESSVWPGCGYNISDGIDCWIPHHNSVDAHRRFCGAADHNLGASTLSTSPPLNSRNGFPNNAIIGQICKAWPTNEEESAQTLLNTPLVSGRSYSLSCWVFNYQGPMGSSAHANTGGMPTWITFATSPGTQPANWLPSSFPIYPSGLNTIVNFSVAAINTWTPLTYTFTYSGVNCSNLLVGPNLSMNLSNGWINTSANFLHYYTLDEVSLIDITPVSITAQNNHVNCQNNLATYTLTAHNVATYTWQPGGLVAQSIIVSPSVTTVYTVTGATACGATSIKTYTVVVNANPQGTIAATNSTICPGASTTLSVTGSGFNQNLNIWTPTPCTPSSCVGQSVTVSPTTTTTYTVKLSSANGCTNTAQATITVLNPTNSINIAGTTTICPGQSTTLTASGGSGYLWNPCSSGCHSSSIVVSPTVTTTYTLTGTNLCGTASTKTITVVVNPPAPVTVNSATICSGNSVTLTASGAVTYTWNPGALTGSSVVVSPTVTTNYTVVGANANGCTNTAISTVIVSSYTLAPFSIFTNVPSPVVANPTGTNTIILSTSITNTTGLMFTWSPSGATTPTTNFNLTQPEIITLDVYNSICPNITTQSICVNYVANTCSNTALPVLNNYTLTSPSQIADGSYFVTGTLTLDWSWDILTVASLDRKNFLMSTGSKVVVTPTSKIAIGLTSFYSCGGMWEGIELQSNATDAAQINLGGPEARIEDAYKAISCTDPKSKIFIGTGVIFNKNYIDIDVSFATNTGITFGLFYASPIYYLSESTANSPGGNLKCSSYYTPIVKARSYAGIKTNNVGVLNYTTTAIPSNYSVVKNKDYGFYFNNTNANVNNVNFNNAIGITYTTGINFITKPAGVGIYSENSGYLNVKPATTPTVGTTTTFTNLGFGIITNNTYTVDIQNTNHTAAAQSYTQNPAWAFNYKSIIWGGTVVNAGYGLNGIFATNARDVLRINNNTISSNYYPITANYTLSPSSTNTMSIAQNTITKGANADTREGVTFNSAVSFAPVPNNMRIAANTFSNVNVGVKVTSSTIGLRVSTNTITLNTAIADAVGVYVAGSNTVTVDNNDIRGNLTSTNVATWNPRNVGILCVNSPGCKIKCNTVTTTGHGIEFRGVNTSSGDGFFNNTFKYPMRRGFVLMNGGIIGTQGSSAGASANQWIAGTSAWPAPATADPNKTSVGGTISGGSASDAINSILYVHNNANELPNDNYFTTPSGINNIYSTALGSLTITAAGNISTCPTTLSSLKVAQSGYSSTVERDVDFVNYINTVLPSSNTDMSPQDKFMLKQFMFDDLTQNPSTNNTLINFVNQQQNTSVDVYHEIDSLLANGYINAANTKNAQASQSNDITQTQNAYNALYINGINSKADLDNLSSIADLCPQLYGNAVYQARALLQSITYVGKVYADSCDNSKVRKEMWLDDEPTSVSLTGDVQAKLYPNPNNGSFTLAYDLKKNNDAEVLIYDVTGKVVYKTSLDNLDNMKQINTNNLHNGIYFIQLIHDKNLLWTDKLIINK